ncbi:hypothetical protein, partial [Streptomyces sp. MBT54]|uniref:hypothetical protein n=1 Tax=Streptomyces sp. MBT54 TaxID=1488385 RepID=UPI001F41884D
MAGGSVAAWSVADAERWRWAGAPTVSPGPGPTRTPELVCSYTRTGNVGRAPTFPVLVYEQT